MKILMVSIFSPHFFNWTLQLKDSGHEIYWLDVLDMGSQVEQINFVNQITGWRNRYEYPGRYWIKHRLPWLYKFLSNFNERKFTNVFKEKLVEIKPDIVHSFEMYSGCSSILNVMKSQPHTKWIYSAWGNDFYYSQQTSTQKIMKDVFSRLDYLFTDCQRDYRVARELGFKGEYLGTFPGGGGYDLERFKPIKKENQKRKIILVKGYENKFGRCNNVLKALNQIKEELRDYKVIVFGANQDVLRFSNQLDFPGGLQVKGNIGREMVFQLMGKAAIYIGNSISDGTPNTLLEAITMGAFPIQSNPGGATAEIIQHEKNGLLINNPEDHLEISELVLKAIQDPDLLKKGVHYNDINITLKFEREYIKLQVLEKYNLVKSQINGQFPPEKNIDSFFQF